MTDDPIKRFRLSEKQPHRDFAMAEKELGPRVRDKDNAQPVIPPPKTVFLPNPRLAPPGMTGSRARFALTPEPKMEGRFKMDDLQFKPLVTARDKSRGHDR